LRGWLPPAPRCGTDERRPAAGGRVGIHGGATVRVGRADARQGGGNDAMGRVAERSYHVRMAPLLTWQVTLAEIGRAALKWFTGWWQMVHLGAVLVVLALSPSSYRGANGLAIARHVVQGTAPILLWFTVLSSLISLVIIRIVVVTSVSYGLSRYALEMVVRVLVLELIPLTAAVFVALRCALPNAAEIGVLRARGGFEDLTRQGVDPLRREVLPRVVAGMFSVLMLAAVSCVVTAVLAYLSVYGFTTGGLATYTRTFGHVFNPAVSMIFALKTFFFSLAVALIPVASVLYDLPRGRVRTSAELQGLVRLFLVLVLIEAASLVGNYY
jgi:phospholipid/cholesterol/gamma-HCH transport system permease protein